ncbi:MAG: GPR endopeptidase [Firmicutes bacterium]|nr:GPR endopeptidase [Bacillota bacterium]
MPQTEWQRRGFRTDLAMEAHELAGGEMERPLPGVHVDRRMEEGNTVIKIVVEDEAAGRALGKLPGHYLTIQTPDFQSQNRDRTEILSRLLAREIENFLARLALGPEDLCFVVVLGNWASTPDSVGPKVVRSILVTRHLWDFSPPEKRGGLRPVCAMAPGVLGLTGLETSEIVFAVVQRIRPRFVVAVDALAARNVERIGTTVQVSDTGIHPGSGLGNNRLGLTPGFLGVPVIAIGIPTVVYATTIVADALEKLGGGERSGLPDERLRRHLPPQFTELVVTPKEVDLLVDEVAKVVAAALNIALHPGVSAEEVFRYLQ